MFVLLEIAHPSRKPAIEYDFEKLLATIDPDELTPREALQKLYELRKEL